MSDSPQVRDEAIVRAYHARTKHRFDAYAEGPGQLDWDAQPAPFRRYPGAPQLELPLSADHFERCYGRLPEKPENQVAANLDSLGALLELSFGISAWKSWGPSRWALRCNPSSGNLHPVEAYVLASGLPGVPDGLHHYEPEAHTLEGRALTVPTDAPPWLAIGLSSIMWREAWKYGERAFRYCQLDVGHAIGGLAYAAALLGWEVRPVTNAALAHCLGLDRPDDFPPSRYAFTETEEPEILLAVCASGLSEPPAADQLATWLDSAVWQGKPTRIDPSPGYRWPAIDQVAAASCGRPPKMPKFHRASPSCRRSRRIPPLPVPRNSSASAAARSVSTPNTACRQRPSTACSMPRCRVRKCLLPLRKVRRIST